MRRIFLALAILLVIVLISGGLYWYFVLSKNPTPEIVPGTKPTPGVGFSSLRPYAYLCVNFQKVDYKISCEKAVELALAQVHGKVKNVSVGSVRTSVPSSSGIERRTMGIWQIDIVLAKPYFDKDFNKQINILQIGIPLDQNNLTYKKPLE